MTKQFDEAVKISGEPMKIGTFSFMALRINVNNQFQEISCAGVPADDVAGFQPACIAFDTTNSDLYRNDGTSLLTSWSKIADGAAGPTGPTGYTGPIGATGPTGPTGYTGPGA
jgi:hypothetical protein